MALLIVVILLVVATILYGIQVQRDLVKREEIVKNSLSNIGIQMQSRWDALIQLANTVKGYKDYETDTLLKVVDARKGNNFNSVEDLNNGSKDFNEAMKELNVLVERYPDLKASNLFTELMSGINLYEDKVRISRQIYNDTATKHNQAIRMFPGSVFAKRLNFVPVEYLETPKEKVEMPDLKGV